MEAMDLAPDVVRMMRDRPACQVWFTVWRPGSSRPGFDLLRAAGRGERGVLASSIGNALLMAGAAADPSTATAIAEAFQLPDAGGAALAGDHTVFCITSVVGCGGGTVRRFDEGSVATALNPSRSNIATVPP